MGWVVGGSRRGGGTLRKWEGWWDFEEVGGVVLL